MIFKDRIDAGKQLAERLAPYRGRQPLVLSVPRGGVVLAREIVGAGVKK